MEPLQLIFVAENSVIVFAIVITLPVVPFIVSNGEIDLMKNYHWFGGKACQYNKTRVLPLNLTLTSLLCL